MTTMRVELPPLTNGQAAEVAELVTDVTSAALPAEARYVRVIWMLMQKLKTETNS